jgi:hypothetical protein
VLTRLKNDIVFASLFAKVADACIANNIGTDSLANMVGGFVTRQKELDMI